MAAKVEFRDRGPHAPSHREPGSRLHRDTRLCQGRGPRHLEHAPLHVGGAGEAVGGIEHARAAARLDQPGVAPNRCPARLRLRLPPTRHVECDCERCQRHPQVFVCLHGAVAVERAGKLVAGEQRAAVAVAIEAHGEIDRLGIGPELVHEIEHALEHPAVSASGRHARPLGVEPGGVGVVVFVGKKRVPPGHLPRLGPRRGPEGSRRLRHEHEVIAPLAGVGGGHVEAAAVRAVPEAHAVFLSGERGRGIEHAVHREARRRGRGAATAASAAAAGRAPATTPGRARTHPHVDMLDVSLREVAVGIDGLDVVVDELVGQPGNRGPEPLGADRGGEDAGR